MCFVAGSERHLTGVCPMCLYFKSSTRCPHKQEVCDAPAHAARGRIVYIRNAEVATFNGCGFCKWARANPAAGPGVRNPGWAGCCRPPGPGERVPPADWRAVAAVHSIPVPPEVKALLDSLPSSAPTKPPSQAAAKTPGSPGSPVAAPSPTAKKTSRIATATASPAIKSPKDASPSAGTPPRRLAKPTDERTPPATLRRRNSASDTRREQAQASPQRTATIGPAQGRAAPAARATALDMDFGKLSLSAPSPLSPGSSGSSDGGSSSDGTVTSDGGFTDYLSDESEAELQRQAEARAVLLAQSHQEDLEFRAARRQLAAVDLRVPKGWGTGPAQGKGVALAGGGSAGYARR